MLHLKSLHITQFKNYSHQRFDFERHIVAITGANGIGKTNLLDAIHYLCFTKSYFTPADSNNVQQGQSGFRLEGNIELNGQPNNVTLILRETGKKEVSCNGTPYDKFSHHIGRFPCVMIAPDDTEIIIGGSELRRKFLDTLLSQINQDYLQQLIQYNKILAQRNSYLKHAAHSQTRNSSLLDVLDEQLISAGNFIYQKRKEFLPSFQQTVLDYYKTIAGKEEAVELLYESQLTDAPFETLLAQNREKDYLLQRCSAGIHKDDLRLLLNGEAFKTKASQGQRKSLLFSLKLAEAATLHQSKGFAPFLLLDDVFEKLDADRMHNLLHTICADAEAQIFITDTHTDRMVKTFEALQIPIQLIELKS